MNSTDASVESRAATFVELPEGRAASLSNGSYSTVLSADGSGYSRLGTTALFRWRPDPFAESNGFDVLIRDRESCEFWSAVSGRSIGSGRRAVASVGEEGVQFSCSILGISTQVMAVVGREQNVEFRTIEIKNDSEVQRALDVTSYLEPVLTELASDAAHPAFSKLFIETDWAASSKRLVATRRPRSPSDQVVCLAHWVESASETDSWESDRFKFIGRGNGVLSASAMGSVEKLSGTVGPVLDPVLSIRRRLVLAPGEEATVHFGLAAAYSADELASLLSPAGQRQFRVDRTPASVELVTAPIPLAKFDETKHLAGDASQPKEPDRRQSRAALESLGFANGYGGFSEDGREYVIELRGGFDAEDLPPLPWINVIANPEFGCIVSERGAGYSWCGNSRENKLTAWSNDPVSDPPSECLYIRDCRSGELWSPVPAPLPGVGAYTVRHGFGYTTFIHQSYGVASEYTVFVPKSSTVKVGRIRLTNCSDDHRQLQLVSHHAWVLGPAEESADGLESKCIRLEDRPVILATNSGSQDFSGSIAFAAMMTGELPTAATTSRSAFLGKGTIAFPEGMEQSSIVGKEAPVSSAGRDAASTFVAPVPLAPGATVEVTMLLGQADDGDSVAALVRAFGKPEFVESELRAVRDFWRSTTTQLTVSTPAPEIDLLVNGWLLYQTLSCRIWGRSAFYQSGGAFGFRDQLQDSTAFAYTDPRRLRDQIVLHASKQFVEGDVLHWWHPPFDKGLRTHFSDDLLWLPYLVDFYARTSGDLSVFDETVCFVESDPLPEGVDELYVRPRKSKTSATIYEHCCLAIDRSLTNGAHGLPLIGTGDWNDGMNRVGRLGRGESVWLGFFLFEILGAFIPICADRQDIERVASYSTYRSDLQGALNDGGWDGEWYRRAYYDNGDPIGSAESDECKIDALAQAWAVISGTAGPDRARDSLDSMRKVLVDEDNGIIRLLAPPFDKTPNDPGYIKGYLPGIRENGGQYTHAALWAVKALAESGHAPDAAELLRMLSPIGKTRNRNEVLRYKGEPYVIAADVYGVEPHIGRVGWTWYTGSAAWMYRVAVESILGLRVEGGNRIRLEPRIPPSWSGFSIQYSVPDSRSTYEIDVTRSAVGRTPGLYVDGVLQAGVSSDVAVVHDGKVHRIELIMS